MLPRTFGVFYDFRNPAQWREPWDVRYRKLIEQVAWVESQPAFGAVSVSEHHFVDDGYTPSVMALCAGIDRIRPALPRPDPRVRRRALVRPALDQEDVHSHRASRRADDPVLRL